MIMVGLFLLGSTFGLILTYFILFGEIAGAFAKDFVTNQDHFYCGRTFYILALTAILSPLFYSKQIKELILVAVGLCVVFAVMISAYGY
jgi:hypothetical protein